MKPVIIVLSGPVGAGKTTLVKLLSERANAAVIKTNEIIRDLKSSVRSARSALQQAGDRLDRETKGIWVRDGVVRRLNELEVSPRFLVVDAIRIEAQATALRSAFGLSMVHVHLDASDNVLAARYRERNSSIAELESYDALRINRTERRVRKLAELADVVIQTDRCTEEDVYTRIAVRLGFRVRQDLPLVDVLVGGQYGSEGKGNVASYLAPEYQVLVRVGGPNAGHKVWRQDEDPFTFHQIPSGAWSNPSALLVIGAGAVIDVDKLMAEISKLGISYERVAIDPQAMVIEEADIEWETAQLRNDIASTAQGVGQATARKLLRTGAKPPVRLAKDVSQLHRYIHDTVEVLSGALYQKHRIMLEGTQGTALSIHHGHYPHVTSRVTTAAGCLAEAGIATCHVRKVIMVCRTYPIRVGDTDTGKTSGYMKQPINLEEIAKRSGIPNEELQKTERTSTTNRPRRIAEFDWSQFRRALALNGPTDIALTFVDYLSARNRIAYRYEQLTAETLRFMEEVEKIAGVPVSLISTEFNMRSIIDRRAW